MCFIAAWQIITLNEIIILYRIIEPEGLRYMMVFSLSYGTDYFINILPASLIDVLCSIYVLWIHLYI